MDTIIQDTRECYRCGKTEPLQIHHLLAGSYRGNKKHPYGAEKYGLKIYLCPECHRFVHDHEDIMREYRKMAQLKAMEFYGWSVDDFIRKVGRNFL